MKYLKYLVSVAAVAFTIYAVLSCIGFMYVAPNLSNPMAQLFPMFTVLTFDLALIVATIGAWTKSKSVRSALMVLSVILAALGIALLLFSRILFI